MGSCASKYGTQTVQVKYYSDCYAPIDQLRKDEADRLRNTVGAGILGGIIGGVLGYQKDGARGAVIGGIGGAVVAGTAAYLITDDIQKKDQAERFTAYSAALDQDIQGLSNAVAGARLVNKCYEDSYDVLKRQYQAGQVDKEEMAARLKELRDGTNDANTVLAKFAAEIAENQLVYQDIQKAEIQRGTSGAQLAVFRNNESQTGQKQSELQHELERMKTMAAIMDSDYQTIHANNQALRMAAAFPAAAICRPMKI